MKPYFAKYIPVEGEIKDGDYYLLYSHGMKSGTRSKQQGAGEYAIEPKWTTHQYSGSTIDKLSNHTPIGDRRKAKLFLCSRDIKEGDKVYKEGIAGAIGEEVLKIAHDGIYGNVAIYRQEDGSETSDFCTNLFKAIGEISPGALSFVKEGDRFDKEDIRIFKTCNSYKSKVLTKLLGRKWEHKEDYVITPGKVIYVKIKGEDGKFY